MGVALSWVRRGMISLAGLLFSACGWASPADAAEKLYVEGLAAPVMLTRDKSGVVHVVAADENSMAFAQGYVHARDRLFQMDLLRRSAGGTLAELLGKDALEDDIMLRTLGLCRAADRTLPLLSDRLRDVLESYAAGVNAYKEANPPPPEYPILGLGEVADWSPLDSVCIAKLVTFQLSADTDDIDRTEALLTYQAFLGEEAGNALFFEDLWRVAPFEPVSTVRRRSDAADSDQEAASRGGAVAGDAVTALGSIWRRRLQDAPILRRMLGARDSGAGSNAFVVSGRLSKSRRPLLANDPHLDLSVPSLFYPIHLRARHAGIDVRGASFAGLPYVVQGVTPHLAWGITASGVDVTDVYQEQLVPDDASPSQLSTIYLGEREHVLPIPETFFINGATVERRVTLIVPRRNQGPIIASLTDGKALSLQWSGFAASFELEAFRGLNRARSRKEFEAALQKFDGGSQNFLYADQTGNIAYYLAGEVPLREDLQAGRPARPPFLVRDGQGGQEWMALAEPPADQALPYQVLPAAEMPKAVNPATGYLINANNDPLGDTFDNNALNQLRPGGGIRYLGADFNLGIRAGRIEQLIQPLSDGKEVSLDDMQAIQADVALPDAAVFVPYIARAFAAARVSPDVRLKELAADDRVARAVQRLKRWRFTTPTGEPEGYDAADENGRLLSVTEVEVKESVAATIYAMWRAQMISGTIDRALGPLPKPRPRYAIRALRHLLDAFDQKQGIGASGLNFFAVPDVIDAGTRRDIIILRSLRDALDRLASADFAPAFALSSDQNDYRWGRLHRLRVEHPLGGQFSLTSPQGAYPPPFAGLPGVPTDGGFETVDRASHDVRAGLAGREKPYDDFVFSSGPIDRFAVELRPFGSRAENALPGGVSGVEGDTHYADLFGPWLTNDSFRFGVCTGDCGSSLVLMPLR